MKRYTEDHEWVEIDGDTATIGISKHAADELGDITFVELPPMGEKVAKGDVLNAIESVKAASDIYSPVGGTVEVINEELETAPELVNDSAEDKGWICKLSGIDTAGIEDLMDPEAYQAFIQD